MKLYDNNPQSKAMQGLIHDTRNCGDDIRFHVKKLRERLKEIGAVDTRAYVHMEHITGRTTEIEKAVDTYYERFSKDFPPTEDAPYKPEVPNAYEMTLKFLNADKFNSEMLPTYNLLNQLLNEYTVIRKPNSDKNVQGSVATDDDSITNAGNKAPKSTTNK